MLTREWGLVSLSLAIMVFAGAITANAVWGRPFDVGSLGQWASAIGTVSAVWIAVHNTTRTLERTEARERTKQEEADRLYILSLFAMSEQVQQIVTNTNTYLGAATRSAADLEAWIRVTGIDGVMKTIDRLPVHQAPDRQILHGLRNIRGVGSNLEGELRAGVTAGSSAPVNLTNLTILMNQTHDGLQSLMKARGIHW